MLTSSNFGQLITPGQRKVFFDELGKSTPQYKQIFRDVKIENKSYGISHIGGFGLWTSGDEGSTIPTEDVKQNMGNDLTVTRYHKGYTISWELLQDDQHGVFNGRKGKNGSARQLAKSFRATMETAAAEVLSGGFSNNGGYDGRTLFATNHRYHNNAATPPTGSNRLEDKPLTVDCLKEACSMMRQTKDESAAAPCGAIPGKLIVHPDDEFTARAILGSGVNLVDGIPTQESTLPNLQIVVLDYLANSDAWFLQAKDMDNLIMIWREGPIFGSQPIAQSMDQFFFGYARFKAGYEDWRGLVGCKKPAAED